MAPPSGVLDGEARWFENGQLTTDAGLARTPFGIPVNCAGAPFGFYCVGLVSQDYNFYLRLPSGKIIGLLTWSPGGSDWRITDEDGAFAGHAMCMVFHEVGLDVYNISLVTNLITGTSGQFVARAPDSQDVPVPLAPITDPSGPAVAYLWWGP
jgi:hypothetical protein